MRLRGMLGERSIVKVFENPSQTRITAATQRNTLADQVTAAEIYFTTFLAEHNIPFLAADHFNKLCKVMFPEAKLQIILLQPELKQLLLLNILWPQH